MNLNTTSNQVIALAGAYQACSLVKAIGRKGTCNEQDFCTALTSILKINADDIDDVYAGINKLKNGLNLLANHIPPTPGHFDIEISRYVYSLISIERKLTKRNDLLELIHRDIELANNKLEYYDVYHANTWSALADIYQNTISRISPRIMVKGESRHLRDEDNAAKIRALLLAGIRSVVLWRQCGGSRMMLAFGKRYYARDIQSLLASMQES